MQARSVKFLALFLCFLIVPAVFAKDDAREPIARMSAMGASAQFSPKTSTRESYSLTVVAPDGTTFQKEFPMGSTPMFRLQDLGNKVIDGPYTYDLRSIPNIPDSVKNELAAARAQDDDALIAHIKEANGIGEPLVQSGTLTVMNGSFINPAAEEPAAGPRSPQVASAGNATTSAAVNHPVTPLDVVTADDEIIQGSLCVGLDCVNNESFGFDTIRLKENNTRIKFDDTSTSAGFPNVDWQLTANDSASGGANKFSIEDITNSKVPFTITATAPTNSLFVASTGKVGFGNSSPGLNLHITATDTPAIRQEQTNGGGFTAQTWDIGANEANWFVRDLTGGSRLPLRIRPGAPTSSVDIAASGNVGIGTASPAFQLDVVGTGTSAIVSRTYANNASGIASIRVVSGNGTSSIRQAYQQFIADETTDVDWRDGMLGSNDFRISDFTSGAEALRFIINSSGNIGIGGVTTPTNPLQHSSGAFLSAGGTWTNASSRDYKDNICDLDSQAAIDTLKGLDPVTYNYKVDPAEHHVGFIAEDVPDLVATKDRKSLSPMDIVAVLTKVVQEQQKTIDQLKTRLDQIESNKQ
jgi:hypothetical protein